MQLRKAKMTSLTLICTRKERKSRNVEYDTKANIDYLNTLYHSIPD